MLSARDAVGAATRALAWQSGWSAPRAGDEFVEELLNEPFAVRAL